MPKQKRKILIIGRTGNGKSTLANVLTNTSRFKESEYGVSETKSFQLETLDVDDLELTVVDTIGIGDTSLSAKEVLYKIADACYRLREGLHQVIFVTSGRFTKEEAMAFDIMRSVIFNAQIVRYTTIVRTRFPSFRNAEKCEEDKRRMLQENTHLHELLHSCNKMIHVNNLTAEEDPQLNARAESRMRLLLHLRGCSQEYRPAELNQLNARIAGYMTDKEKVEVELKRINEQLQEKEKYSHELQRQLEQERQDAEDRINKLKETVSRETGAQIQGKSPGLFEMIFGTIGAVLKKCVSQ